MSVKVPDDISVIGFDDHSIFTALNPALTVIRQDFLEMGNKAATLMLKRIQGDQTDFPSLTYTPVELIKRASVKFCS